MSGSPEGADPAGRWRRALSWPSASGLALGWVALFGLYLGSLYWVATLLATPDKSLMMGILYRHDLQYAPLVESLARLDFSPTYSRYFVGDGIVVFPVVALLLHAVLFKLLGVAGFWAADVVYTTAFCVAGYVLLRRFGVQAGLAVAALMLNFFLALPELKSLLSELSLPPILASPAYLSLVTVPLRMPRPLVSAPIFLIIIISLKYLWDANQSIIYKWKIWCILLLAYSIIFQSNIYQFMGLSLPIAVVIAVVIAAAPPEGRWRVGRCLSGALLLFSVFSMPFVIQILLGSPSLGTRAGIFDVPSLQDRLQIVRIFLLPLLRQDIFYTNCIFIVILFSIGGKLRKDAIFLFILLFGYIISLFFYIMILPRQAQVYHYFRDDLCMSIVVFLAVLVLIQHLIERLRERGSWARIRIFGWVVVSLMLTFAFVTHTDGAVQRVAKGVAARPKMFPPAVPKRMRRDVAKVLSHLDRRSRRSAPDDRPMLLTNDNMVLTWWVMSDKGTLLLPDVFSVTLTQAAVEQKLAQAGRILGLSDEAFVDLLNVGAYNSIFLGHNKYQASHIWHAAPLWDYPSEIRKDLMQQDKDVWFHYSTAWRLVLPLSYQEHLREYFKDYVLDDRFLPDYVVIARLKTFPRDLSLPEGYKLTLNNRNYRVWIRQK